MSNLLRQNIDSMIFCSQLISWDFKLLRLLPLFIFFLSIKNDANCQASPERLGNHIISTGIGLILNGKAGEVDLLYEYVGITNRNSFIGLQAGVELVSRLDFSRGVVPLYLVGLGYNYKIKDNRVLGFDFLNLLSDETGYAPEIDLSYSLINLNSKKRIELFTNVIFTREVRKVTWTGASLTPIRPLFGVGIKIGRYFGK